MIFLLPHSSDKNQTTHAFSGARQGKEMLFLFISVNGILANIPKKCFARCPVHCLSSSHGYRGRSIKPEVLDVFTTDLTA